MKKIVTIIFILFGSFILFSVPSNVEAKTLREMKEELATAKANLSSNQAKMKEAQERVKKYKNEINTSTNEILKCQEEIEEARIKIQELEEEIKEKQKEIDELLRFLQVSKGENVYLEYVFGATSFTDFIYRTAIVEQLSDYNDKLIDEMYDLIEQNKQLQKELEAKIKELEKKIEQLKKDLSKVNLTIDDLYDDQKDLNAEIKAYEVEIKFYEDYGCKLDQEISDCLNVPYANGFVRPTDYGYISSNYGWRSLNLSGSNFHSGIDIALPEGNKVYPSAPGYVAKKVIKSNCGGNMLYVQHSVGGKKYTTVYMHLKSFNVNVGDTVFLTTVIAYSGGSSTSVSHGGYDRCTTGAHLHFGMFNGWTSSKAYLFNPRDKVNFPAIYNRYYSRW